MRRTSFGRTLPSAKSSFAPPHTAPTPSPAPPSAGSATSVKVLAPRRSARALRSAWSPVATTPDHASRPSARTFRATFPFAPAASTPHAASNAAASPSTGISTANGTGVRSPKKCFFADVEKRFSIAAQATSHSPAPRTTFDTSNISAGT